MVYNRWVVILRLRRLLRFLPDVDAIEAEMSKLPIDRHADINPISPECMGGLAKEVAYYFSTHDITPEDTAQHSGTQSNGTGHSSGQLGGATALHNTAQSRQQKERMLCASAKFLEELLHGGRSGVQACDVFVVTNAYCILFYNFHSVIYTLF